jgi:hypothetical protein
VTTSFAIGDGGKLSGGLLLSRRLCLERGNDEDVIRYERGRAEPGGSQLA